MYNFLFHNSMDQRSKNLDHKFRRCGLIFFLTLILIGFIVLAVVYVVFLQSFYIALIWIGLALILIGFIGLAVYFKKGCCDKSVSQSDIGVGKPGISIPKYA